MLILLKEVQVRLDLRMLTFDCINYTVAIFYQLFQEFARPVQLEFIALERLSEVRTVLVAVTKL